MNQRDPADPPRELARATTDSVDKRPDKENPAEMQADIARTRAQMSVTIDAIQERLNPQVLKDHVKETIREATIGRAEQVIDDWSDTARGVSFDMFETIRHNPIPAALAGFGLAWLLAKAQNQHRYDDRFYNRGDRNRSNREFRGPGYAGYPGTYRGDLGYPDRGNFQDLGDYGTPYDEMPERNFVDAARRPAEDIGRRARQFGSEAQDRVQGIGDQVGNQVNDLRNQAGQLSEQVRGQAGHLTDQVRDQAGQLGDQVREQVGQMGDQAGQLGDQVREQVGQMGNQVRQMGDQVQDTTQQLGEQARYQAYMAKSSIERLIEDNPLAIGAMAIAFGVAIGLAAPGTQQENRLMGDLRDDVMDRAQTMAHEKLGDVQERVQKVAETAQEALKETTDEVKKQASEVASATFGSSTSSSGTMASSAGQSSPPGPADYSGTGSTTPSQPSSGAARTAPAGSTHGSTPSTTTPTPGSSTPGMSSPTNPSQPTPPTLPTSNPSTGRS